jgi:amino acid adenylation domain-containing protein
MSDGMESCADLPPESKRELLAKLLQERANDAPAAYRLSNGQQALWFLHQSSPDSSAYNTAFAGRIVSEVNVEALRSVLQALIDRHPSLRTTFLMDDGELMQHVNGHQALQFERVDAAAWTFENLCERVAANYRRPFFLDCGPLIRASLFTRSERDHVLLLSFHHIVCDAWSIWLLLDEFHLLYPAATSGRKESLPSLASRYSDYVRWQRQMLAGPEGDLLEAYWRKQLSGELPILNLATDRSRPPIQTYRGATHFFTLSAKLIADLRTLAKAEQVTLYMTFLAAFQVLLHRYTEQDDIIVGSPASGRTRAEFAEIVGYFVNPVPLRANFAGRPTFKAFLRQIRQTVLGALAHQDYPFSLLIEKLRPRRDPSRSPIFQALFVHQKPQHTSDTADLLPLGDGSKPVHWGGLLWEPFPLAQMEGQFDLTLEIFEAGSAALKYNADLFDPDTVRRMALHFETLLETIVANPGLRILDLPLLTGLDRQQLLVAWTNTGVGLWQGQSIHQIIEAQVCRTPESVAVVFNGEKVTYRELNNRANRIAHHLRALGVGPEILVGICVERSIEMVVGLLAILKAGGAYVPLDPSHPRERLAFMLDDSGVSLLLTKEKFARTLSQLRASVICLDGLLPGELQDGNPVSGLKPENAAYVIYTSGSTGRPKGVVNTHGGICNRLLWMQDAYGLGAADRVLQKTPFTFDVSIWEFFWPLMTGARLVMARPGGHQESEYLVQLISAESITTLHFIPSMLQSFLAAKGVERCGSIRHVFSSGEALPYQLQERFFACLEAELHNLYGPTEAAVDVTFWRCERESRRKIVPLGRPITGTQIYILDRNLQPVPVGVPGELHISGDGLARGYLNRPGLTAEKFIPNPFPSKTSSRLYKSGDLARYLPDGAIEYLGRLDHQIKIRGFRIELGEIEASLAKHSGVSQVMVVAHDEPQGERQLVAYVVPSSGNEPRSSELRQFLLRSLPDYMAPSRWVFLEAFPLGANGKLDRRALPIPASVRPRIDAAYVMPQTPMERELSEVWQKVLRVDVVGIHDNFFELGGHSLLLGQVHVSLQEIFGQNLSMPELFQFPTIHSLARYLCGRLNEAPAPEREGRAQTRAARRISMEQQKLLRQQQRETTSE